MLVEERNDQKQYQKVEERGSKHKRRRRRRTSGEGREMWNREMKRGK